ncbi:response regulator [Ideonella sp. 4Y11]|uniref:Virulence sensor protein BvgS n=1 Tax=Ideonella aquatica TaxID=2824119 RepID=A0A941BJM2_9BURK|nr:ATP-binding protein [Ideonella aquatica]MBQ0957629.1 response regulator [Ideonella aquatica]
MDAATPPVAPRPQQVIPIRRDYNAWVASETLEDYALRFTPRSFRKWSPWRVANTAFGAASFLVLEAVGATLLVQHGFVNAFWAILATGLAIFLAGWPISVYAARHGVDMDLLTRGAGFGYLGSTVTSLIYASFTFIFFALEAAIMAYALELVADIPPAWGYLLCALVVIPLVAYGVTALSRLQVWTQPLWLAMLVLPYIAVLQAHPDWWQGLQGFSGQSGGAGFDLLSFGAATTVGMALITQMGEQVDYLRFMPEPRPGQRARWWLAVAAGGPGWVIPGVLKMLGGALLAWLALQQMVPPDRAVDPNQMYLLAWEQVLGHYHWAVAATAVFVVVSQLKINVTNAYAGSLAWSNFFSRATHSHPGRVVWMVFNLLIALMLMELSVFQALERVLGLFANLAISWLMAVVADLVINKPLGWSPKGIEFRRAYLHDINPVGVGAMGLASVLSMAAHLGAFGPLAQAFSALVAAVTAFCAAPAIAWATRGRYYLARDPAEDGGRYLGAALHRCLVCERDYEADDMAGCPAYGGPICSLCCTLDARCQDRCKPTPRISDAVWGRWRGALRRLLPRAWAGQVDTGLGQYLLMMAVLVPLLGGLAALLVRLARSGQDGYWQVFATMLLLAAVVAWWLVLAQRSRAVAQEETERQTDALVREIDSHRQTDLALQAAKRLADAANQAKTRYITAVSHELRTPLNSILGYAQLLGDDPAIPAQRRPAVEVIRRGGEHLLGLIEGTLDIARIESGKLRLDVRPMRLREAIRELVTLFEQQAQAKGIGFAVIGVDALPEAVRADERRLRQILINLLGNAVKFTRHGQVTLRAAYSGQMARFEVVDTGPGMDTAEVARVFEPFERGSAAGGSAAGGTGLGLTISRMLTGLMGGELTLDSTPGQGSIFRLKLFLPEVAGAHSAPAGRVRHAGYAGPRRTLLVVDNEEADRQLLADLLQPLGFTIEAAGSGEAALARLASLKPDAIFMDLAMPGIDGWETIRRLRAQGLSRAPLAVVSANAFDRALDHDVDLPPEDFLVKPVRLDDLLAWLERRLQLQWIAAPPPTAPPPPAPETPPPAAALQRLNELVGLGYLRGITQELDRLEAAHADSAAFIARLRGLARGFQLDALADTLKKALNEPAV